MEISKIALEKVKIGGRTNGRRDPVTLIWSGSFVELWVKAGELQVLVEGPFDTYENWIAIEINGEIVSRRMVNKEKEWIQIFRMRNPEQLTKVKIIKEVQAFATDTQHRLNLYEIETDGEFLPVEDAGLKIEFIGDSITSAEGCVGAKEETEWIASLFSHVNSYPYFVGKKLNADINVISQSGWGIYSSWDCNIDCAIPKHYEKIYSLSQSEYFEKNGYNTSWQFEKWQPDVIIINLGTNDDGAFHNTECENSQLLRMDKDEYNPEDLLKVRSAIISFLKLVRKKNPEAYIIWGLGMIENEMTKVVKEETDHYRQSTGDKKIEFIALPAISEDTVGARCHPGRSAHYETAKLLVNRIMKIM